MRYLLDFDRTLFDTNAFMRAASLYCATNQLSAMRPNPSDFVYRDAHLFLEAHQGTATFTILTAGEEELQRAKVEASGLLSLVDDVHIVPVLKGEAAAALCALPGQDKQVVFLDDSLEQLADVARAVPAVLCVRMRRPGSGYTSLPSSPPGMHEIANFVTLDALIRDHYGTNPPAKA